MTTQCTVLLRRRAHIPRVIARLDRTEGKPLRRAMERARAASAVTPSATVSVFISCGIEAPREIARYVAGEEVAP